MKGWIDRVLTKGYAYSERTRYSQGVFKVTLASSNYCTSGEIQTLLHTQDKKAILSFTTGSQELMFGSNGINGDMNVTLWPIQVLCHEATNKVSINKGANGLLSLPEWHPELLWLPGSAPSDFLGTISCSSRAASQHAGELACATARPPG